ncbi:MAG: cytochrome c biogenesis protein CcsA [Chloroflexi bacterium]|nr:cytochrome c biogenesis protein CcsA [Chloroflexota bacterium]
MSAPGRGPTQTYVEAGSPLGYEGANIHSYWLVIHVGFAKLAFGTVPITFGLGVVYLLKRRAERRGSRNHFYASVPELARIDGLGYRFTGLGFVFMAIMIFSGSIWAHQAWGNYWSWDPIETWSAATWVFYGINLHLRTLYRLDGYRAAWLSMATLALSVSAFFGVAYVARGAHVEYLVT